MSYCRFSIDDTSDVYAFEHIEGHWQIYVAASRRVHPRGVACPPLPPPRAQDREVWVAEWIEAHKAQMAWSDEATLIPIGLEHDGGHFEEPTPGACADRLDALRAAGYHVPQHAIDELRAEAAEVA